MQRPWLQQDRRLGWTMPTWMLRESHLQLLLGTPNGFMRCANMGDKMGMIGMKSWTHGLYMFVLCVICVLCVLLFHEINRIKKIEKHIVWWLVPISGATPLKLSCWCTAVCNQADRWGDILEFVEAKKDGNWIMLILWLCITYTEIYLLVYRTVYHIFTTKVQFSWSGREVCILGSFATELLMWLHECWA